MLRLRNNKVLDLIKLKYIKPFSVVSNIKNTTHLEEINKDDKMKKYIKDIYKYSGYGFGGSLVTSVAVGGLSTATILYAPGAFVPLCGLWIGNVGFSFYSLNKISKMRSSNKNLLEIIPQDKKKWYTLFCISNGIMLSPLTMLSFTLHPMIFPLAFTSTVGTFAGASLYALSQKNLDAIKWQGPLMGCVSGLICSSLVQIGATFMGYTSFAHNLDIISTLVSTGVFTGLIIADTQQGIKDFQDKNLDSINTSVDLLLDATNLFIDFIKIFSEISKHVKND